MKVTIEEYAQRFQMSVEMVKAKVRHGRLTTSLVNGVTMIELPAPRNNLPTPAAAASINLETTLVLLKSCRNENLRLKSRITSLEAKIDSLIDDKENMLKEERDRIETIYAARDEQLKHFLEAVNTRLLQQGPSAPITDATLITKRRDDEEEQASRHPIELLRYLRMLNLPEAARKKIIKRFARGYGGDIRIIQQDGAFYLDFSKYDYSDLLRH